MPVAPEEHVKHFCGEKSSGEKHFTAGKVLWLLEIESTARSSVFRLTLIKVRFVLYPLLLIARQHRE